MYTQILPPFAFVFFLLYLLQPMLILSLLSVLTVFFHLKAKKINKQLICKNPPKDPSQKSINIINAIAFQVG